MFQGSMKDSNKQSGILLIESEIFPSQVHGAKCWPQADVVSPCEIECPLGQDVPNYVIAIAQGKFDEALTIIRQTNPLPSICSRVCHHPCEDVCNRKFIEESISIRALKQAAVDYGNESSNEVTIPVKGTKQDRIAIIGSGPAGLTAAHDLAKKGYLISIYEASSIVGGVLATAIPEFVLPRKILEADINYIKNLGVKIKTNIAIGKDLSIEDLYKLGFKAVLIATGAQENTKLPVPGVDLEGVTYALPFLMDAKIGSKQSLVGKKVIVIGGGNVAVDAARCALRLQAEEVHMTCLESRDEMPAYTWEIDAALNEGIKLHTSVAPQQFVAGHRNKIGKIEFRRVASFTRDKDSHVSWTLIDGPDSEFSLDTDFVIIAIGQVPTPPEGVGKIKISSKKTLEVDPITMETSLPGVFAAGDVVTVPGTVTGSMAEGRRAAMSIDLYMQRKNLKKNREKASKAVFEIDPDAIPRFLRRQSRWQTPSVVPSDAIRSFEECNLGYTRWQAIEEAQRCLNCRMCGNCLFEHIQICQESAGRLLI